MFKFLIYLYVSSFIIIQNEGKTFKRGRLNDSVENETPWQNLWFPYPPNYQSNVKLKTINVAAAAVTDSEEDSPENRSSTEWSGLWFPNPPNYREIDKENIVKFKENGNEKPKTINVAATDSEEDSPENRSSTAWSGLWFPNPPNYQNIEIVKENIVKFKKNDNKHECDNGKYDLAVDYDPYDKRHSYNYLCLDNRKKYAPKLNTSAVIKEYLIPSAYEPPIKCLNESIDYTESLPTFGAYRPLAPKFGSYQYLPPQRWIHSLSDGAIVLLYHPCAFAGQIEQLQNTLKGCLYRHVITPSQQLTSQRPLALLAWGKSLQMSVVDDAIVVKFIKDHAKLGFRQKQHKLKLSSKLYDAGLLSEAHLVTDEQDKEICGYKEM